MAKQMSIHAQCAKAIRTDLKKEFPGFKFSVRSESYSMGDSVRILWADGPTVEEVSSITSKYQQGHFNGMEDIYEYSNSKDDIPQTKFVQTSRTMSDEIRDKIIERYNEKFCVEGQIKGMNAWNEDAQCWNSDVVYRVFNKLSLAELAQ